MNVQIKVFVFVFLVIGGCKENTPSETEKNIIRDIEKVELRDLNEQLINADSFKGKSVFLNFWATWCKPCIIEMEYIDKAQSLLQNENVVFILASNESADEIRMFQNENAYKFTYVQVVNSEGLNIPALPTTFIYNSDGKLVFSHAGVKNWADSSNISLVKKIIHQ